jgi:WD40 repeat protein
VPDPATAQGAKTWTSDDGRRVLVLGRDGVYRLLDGPTGRPIGGPLPIPPPDDPGEVSLVVAFSPDGRRMATCRTQSKGNSQGRRIIGQELRTWDALTGEPTGPPVPIKDLMRSDLAFSPDGRRLRADGVGGNRFLDATTLQPDAAWSQILGRAQGPVVKVSLSPDGRWLLTWSSSSRSPLPEADACQLWDAATGRVLGEIRTPDSTIISVVFSPDGRRLATGHRIAGRTAVAFHEITRLWDLPSCRPIGREIDQAISSELNRSEFSADGSILLIRSGSEARLWDSSSGRAIGEPLRLQRTAQYPPRHSTAVFSPDSRLLAIGTEDHYAQLIDAHTGQPVSSQLPHTAEVVALAFAPDGDVLLTGSADGMARLWHVATGRPVGPPLEHDGRRIDRVAFAPDGRSMVTWYRISDSCTVVRSWAVPTSWPGDVAAIRRRVERMTNRRLDAADVPRPLSAEECHARADE